MHDYTVIEKALGKPPESETYGIYVGYQQIGNCRGPTKVGRTVNVRALQRGRSQGGADWLFYAFWSLENRAKTYEVEKTIKLLLKNYSIVGNQRQKELYSLCPEEATKLIEGVLGKSII